MVGEKLCQTTVCLWHSCSYHTIKLLFLRQLEFQAVQSPAAQRFKKLHDKVSKLPLLYFSIYV